MQIVITLDSLDELDALRDRLNQDHMPTQVHVDPPPTDGPGLGEEAVADLKEKFPAAPPQAVEEQTGTPPPPPPEVPTVDADGIAWDERIHSSSKKLNKDGTWKARRGVSDDLVKQVHAEQRGDAVGPANNPPAVPPPPTGDRPVWTFNDFNQAVFRASLEQKVDQPALQKALTDAGVQNITDLAAPENADKVTVVAEALGLCTPQ